MSIKYNITLALGFILTLYSCADEEVVTTYEEVKEVVEGPQPITFSPYVGTAQDKGAFTRANLHYLSYYDNTKLDNWNNILFLGQQHSGDRRLGQGAYNNYIVGIYGFWHEGSDWATDHEKSNFRANFMTNQPLLHLLRGWAPKGNGDWEVYWDYSPLRYWPNSSTDKVTFVSYYPFQDYEERGNNAKFESVSPSADNSYFMIKVSPADETKPLGFYRDGTGSTFTPLHPAFPGLGLNSRLVTADNKNTDYWSYKDATFDNADLTCIVPPANNATGKDAYTFRFTQKSEAKEQIDFMVGINKDIEKHKIGESVDLTLRHALCGIKFETNLEPLFYLDNNGNTVYHESLPNKVEWKINSLTLKGFYETGEVTPGFDTSDNITLDWVIDTAASTRPDNSASINAAATVDIAANENYDSSNPISSSNMKYKITSKDKNIKIDYTVGNNENLQKLLLVLPQTAPSDAYLEVNYDLTYTYNDATPKTVKYWFCVDKIPLANKVFPWGKIITFKLNFYLSGISMDAEINDWEDAGEKKIYLDESTGS